MISICLWRAGFGFTDPGYTFYHWEAKSFDPGPERSQQLVDLLRKADSGTADSDSLVRNLHKALSFESSTAKFDFVNPGVSTWLSESDCENLTGPIHAPMMCGDR